MRSAPLFIALLALNFLTGATLPLKAQTRQLVIGVDAVCMNYMSPYDDLENLVEDLNDRYNARGIFFVPSRSDITTNYTLKIWYKKDGPATYSSFQAGYKTQVQVRVEPELPRPPGNYPLQETTSEERLQAASVRSPGTTLVPYAQPLLDRPGGNMPLPAEVVRVSSNPGISTLPQNAYTYLYFRLYDAPGQKLIWSQKMKTNRSEDIYAPIINALAVQLDNL